MIDIKGLSIQFKDNVVLDNVNFFASPGEIIGVVAPNGTGKTTLFNVLMNFVIPQSGDVNVFGLTHPKETIRIRKDMTVLPNQADLFEELTGFEHLNMYSKVWGNQSNISQIIERLDMESYVKKKIHTYSLGMKQRLCFGLVLAANTKIMLLDEVMNGLDPHNVSMISQVLRDLRDEGKCILIASHLLTNLDLYADRTIFLHKGKIIHELNKANRLDKYWIVYAERNQLEEISQLSFVQERSCVFAESMIAIPVVEEEGSKLLNKLFALGVQEVKISPLGTAEYYDIFYQTNKLVTSDE